MGKVAIILSLIFSLTANCSNNVIPVETEQGARPPVQSRDTGAAKEPQTPSAPRVGENNVGVGGNPELSFAPRVVAHPAAYDFNRYLPGLRGKRVGLVVNQTSTVSDRHLVDALLDQEINVKIIFAPEHGFRGEADAGATISNGTDVATGLPIKSLYGKNKKPSAADLAGVDVIVFDVQDVGARFYTYISTLLYVMESAARYGKEVLVLDRPNPNGKLIDGPVLKSAFTSFVGVAPIPVAHGLTVGEFARMANGEDWLADGLKTELTVIPMLGYAHDQVYELPTPPSPNLPNQRSIYLYPHLCFFEGTALSVGRGTMKQFQLYGHPSLSYGNIRFTPTPGPGSSSPKLEGQLCRGEDLTQLSIGQLQNLTQLNLEYLTNAHRDLTDQGITFFTRPDFFDLLAGTDELRKAISAGATPAQIRATWADDLADYRSDRQRYLLYP